MTGVEVAALLALAVICAAAAWSIGVAKDRGGPGMASAGFLLGPVGLAYVALARPGDLDEGRLDWWRDSGARVWTVVAALAFVGWVALWAVEQSGPADLDGSRVERQVEQWLHDQGSRHAVVDCPPTVPAREGYTFLCSAVDRTGSAHVRVTVDNDQGDVEWKAVG